MRPRPTRLAIIAVIATALSLVIAPLASASTAGGNAPTAQAGHSLNSGTHFYTPPWASGSVQQIVQLLAHREGSNAALIAGMESVPSAVWLDGETATQAADGAAGEQQADFDAARSVREALAGASFEHAVPVFVAYNIPGRDCSQYSAGGGTV